MRFPAALSISLAVYILKNRIRGIRKFPLVLMLEPTHRCNLFCLGCGRIREYKPFQNDTLSLNECLRAVDESGARIVSICGGEPLLYSDITALVDNLVRKKIYVYLCTNGLLLEEFLPLFKLSPFFALNIHLDGLAKTHDRIVGRGGVFNEAIKAITKAKAEGFTVCTNTTIYKGTAIEEIEELFYLLRRLKVDGYIVSPSYAYGGVDEGVYLNRSEIIDRFKRLKKLSKYFRFYNTPVYLEFLEGKRALNCTPWGNPTRNPQGWKSPCYLITDAHYPTFNDLMQKTGWDNYGYGKDPRCERCMTHCGFEPTVALGQCNSLIDNMRLLKWHLF